MLETHLLFNYGTGTATTSPARTIGEMKSAVEFLDKLCSHTTGPHLSYFQATLICFKDILVHLEYKSGGAA